MKKVLFFPFVVCLGITPVSIWAQKKAVVKKKLVVPAALPVIKTANDTLSYAMGLSMVQGLPAYLIQLGVLSDTASVKNEFDSKISSETDVVKKAGLEKALQLKLDSVKTANAKNLDQFLAGFESAIGDSKDKAAYNAGISIAGQVGTMMEKGTGELFEGADNFNRAAFLHAFTSGIKDEKPLLSIESPQNLLQERAQEVQKVKEAEKEVELKAQYADKIAAGQKFFTENKAKADVVTLPSGLQYKVDREGTGPKGAANEKVKVHYKGTLLDGTVFDSSYERGEPADFAIGQLIQGFNEALLLMPEGSKWTVYIPYNLAYGSADRGVIKPFSDLIFEIELLHVGDAPKIEESATQDSVVKTTKSTKSVKKSVK